MSIQINIEGIQMKKKKFKKKYIPKVKQWIRLYLSLKPRHTITNMIKDYERLTRFNLSYDKKYFDDDELLEDDIKRRVNRFKKLCTYLESVGYSWEDFNKRYSEKEIEQGMAINDDPFDN